MLVLVLGLRFRVRLRVRVRLTLLFQSSTPVTFPPLSMHLARAFTHIPPVRLTVRVRVAVSASLT